MATKKTKQPTKAKKPVVTAKKMSIFSRIWQFAKDNPALAFLIVALICGVVYGSIYIFERWQFSTAEKKLDSIATALVAELGKPTSIEKNKSCSYQSTVFEDQRGLPACGVSYVIKYDIHTNVIDIESSINEALKTSFGNYTNSKYTNPSISLERVILYGFNYHFMKCSASINEINVDAINENIYELDSKNRIYIFCGKNSTLNKPYQVI